MAGLPQLRPLVLQALHHPWMGQSIAATVPYRDQGMAGAHTPHKSGRGGAAAAMMGHLQHIHRPQVRVTQQGALLRRLNIAGEQNHPTRHPYTQHTGAGITLAPGTRPGIEQLKLHPVPVPAPPRPTGGGVERRMLLWLTGQQGRLHQPGRQGIQPR